MTASNSSAPSRNRARAKQGSSQRAIAKRTLSGRLRSSEPPRRCVSVVEGSPNGGQTRWLRLTASAFAAGDSGERFRAAAEAACAQNVDLGELMDVDPQGAIWGRDDRHRRRAYPESEVRSDEPRRSASAPELARTRAQPVL
jgi:hypothetical protein